MMRHWLGTALHLLYPPMPDPRLQLLAAQMDERREHMASLSASRERLERLAADPLDATLQSIIKDL